MCAKKSPIDDMKKTPEELLADVREGAPEFPFPYAVHPKCHLPYLANLRITFIGPDAYGNPLLNIHYEGRSHLKKYGLTFLFENVRTGGGFEGMRDATKIPKEQKEARDELQSELTEKKPLAFFNKYLGPPAAKKGAKVVPGPVSMNPKTRVHLNFVNFFQFRDSDGTVIRPTTDAEKMECCVAAIKSADITTPGLGSVRLVWPTTDPDDPKDTPNEYVRSLRYINNRLLALLKEQEACVRLFFQRFVVEKKGRVDIALPGEVTYANSFLHSKQTPSGANKPYEDEQIDAWFHGIMVQGGTTKAPEPYEVTKITFNTVQSAKAAAAAPGLQFVCEVCPTSEGWKEYSKFSPEEKEEFRRETGSIPNGNGVPLSIKPEKMDTEFYVRDWGTAGKTPASVVIASMRCWLGQLIFSGADKGGIGARMSANAITRANLESELPCWPFSCIPIRNFNGNFLTNKGYMGFNPAAEGTKVADAIALIKNRRAARNTIPQSIPILQQQQQPVNTDNFVGKVVDTGNMLEDSEKAEDGAEANGQAVPAVPAVTEIAATDDGGDFNPEF